jgi:hypothetical protein
VTEARWTVEKGLGHRQHAQPFFAIENSGATAAVLAMSIQITSFRLFGAASDSPASAR